MPNPVVHFEIIGKDANKLRGFYSQLFGWHIDDTNNPQQYGMVDTHSGKGIGGGIGAGDPKHPSNRVTVYVEVDDLAAALKKAESLGGKTVMPPTDLPQVSFAMFTDPEGNLIGLSKGM